MTNNRWITLQLSPAAKERPQILLGERVRLFTVDLLNLRHAQLIARVPGYNRIGPRADSPGP